jgi:hypothetical protein
MELTPVCRETVLPATAESAKRGLWDGMNYSNLLRRSRKPSGWELLSSHKYCGQGRCR